MEFCHVGIGHDDVLHIGYDWVEFFTNGKYLYKTARTCRTYEDLERFLYDNGRLPMPASVQKPPPQKRLYLGFQEHEGGGFLDGFDFMVWAETKAQVIEYLRGDVDETTGGDWWLSLVEQLQQTMSKSTIETMHPFDLLRLLEDHIDGGITFRIVEISKSDVVDIPKRFRREARRILKTCFADSIPKDLMKIVVDYVA